ncbi:1-aminocyclopropane-1-carboxylate oxidase homolog 1 [Lolium perenne]|uniref:1-aminocyclopropane-1-carboxylate oxidase homolog 1 n=1 Tax=Lolium perenne TaxID=4522 RepID=UPI0021EB1E42|nr:1-aminocyclopropane-1-carboxylate oxidase homolog 1-like [Lolium perenne]
MAGAAEVYDYAAALAEFDASRTTVRSLVESGIASVPPLFISTTNYPPTDILAIPTVDLSLPLSSLTPIVGAAAQTCGFFHVTNHGIDAGAAVSSVRAFHELPPAVRSAFYSVAAVEGMSYSTVPYMDRNSFDGPGPILPWRVSLRVLLQAADIGRLPAACRDALVVYLRCIEELGKKMARLLSEALGVGAERLETATQVEGWLMACNYYPPCPEPARVEGAVEHTDPSLFTVLAQDGIGGLQVRINGGDNDGQWVDVPPVPGALLVNVGDVLKLVSNNEYHSVGHRVMIKSSQDARASLAVFFNPAMSGGDSNLLGPLQELITTEKPAMYRSFTMTEFMDSRRKFGHGKLSTDQFRVALE